MRSPRGSPALLLVVLLTLAPALAGCFGTPQSVQRAAKIPVYRYVATDHAFEGPSALPAGLVRIRMENLGQDLHHFQLLRVPAERTLEDLQAFVAEHPHAVPEWAENAGGPGAVSPGGTSEAVVRLTTGKYLLVCVVPDREGVPHVLHGMGMNLTVVPRSGDAPPEPRESAVITLTDFNFTMDRDIAPGTRAVLVRNQGLHPHEAVVVRLDDNATAAAFLAGLAPNATAPPPGRFVGGTSVMEPADRMWPVLEFTPGRYALLCFVVDPETGQPHFAMGMVHEFTVR